MMDNFIQTALGQRMADAIIKIAQKYTAKRKQYSVFCGKYEASNYIEENLKKGSKFIAIYEVEDYCTIIFEEG